MHRVPALGLLAISSLTALQAAPSTLQISADVADNPYEETLQQPNHHWMPSERWAWARIQAGLTVDFNEKIGQPLSLTSTDIDQDQRTNRSLGATFLATVLGDSRFQRQIPVSHVQIRGAYFPDTVDLRNISTPIGLEIRGSVFESDLEMLNFASAGSVAFKHTVLGGEIAMTSAHAKELHLSHFTAKRIVLNLATISGSFTITSSTITQTLELGRSKVARLLSILKSNIGDIQAPGIRVDDRLNLADSTVHGPINLNGSQLQEIVIFSATMGKVDLADARVYKALSVRESKISGTLSANRVRIGADLFVLKSEISTCMDFSSTEVSGSVQLKDSSFGQLTGSNSKVMGSFHVERIEVQELVDLKGLLASGIFAVAESQLPGVDVSVARFGGPFVVQDSTITGESKINSVDTRASFFLRRSKLMDIDLMGGKFGGRLAVTDSEISGNLLLQSATVEGDLVLADSNVDGEIDAQVSKVSGFVLIENLSKTTALGMRGITSGGGFVVRNSASPYIELSGATTPTDFVFIGSTIGVLNLTSASSGQSMVFGGSPKDQLSWTQVAFPERPTRPTDPKSHLLGSNKKGLLILQDARTVNFKFDKASFPELLEFDGFKAVRLSPLGIPKPEIQTDWLASWLERDPTYSPGPYTEIAKALRASGNEGLADDVLVLRRERERDLAHPLEPRWWGSTGAKYLIGYGYGWRTFRALLWVGALSLLGTLVLLISGNRRKTEYTLGFWYSLDLLIPGIRLRQRHYDAVELTGWANYYFYVHKIFGYLLLFFVLAGLSGLVQ